MVWNNELDQQQHELTSIGLNNYWLGTRSIRGPQHTRRLFNSAYWPCCRHLALFREAGHCEVLPTCWNILRIDVASQHQEEVEDSEPHSLIRTKYRLLGHSIK